MKICPKCKTPIEDTWKFCPKCGRVPRSQENVEKTPDPEREERKRQFTAKLIQSYETAIIRIILYCVGELPFPLGSRKILDILKGTKSTFVIEHDLHELSMFGVLAPFPMKYLQQFMEKLLVQEFLEVSGVSEYNMPTVLLSSKGKEVLKDAQYAVTLGVIQKNIDKTIIEFNEEEERLFERLKHVRWKLSKQKEFPAYTVCGDSTLRRITKQKPTTEQELLDIKGIGENFIQNYGTAFLQEIASFQNPTIATEDDEAVSTEVE